MIPLACGVSAADCRRRCRSRRRAAARAHPESGSPATTGHRNRNHAMPGPGFDPVAADDAHVVRAPVADIAGAEERRRTRRRHGPAAESATMHTDPLDLRRRCAVVTRSRAPSRDRRRRATRLRATALCGPAGSCARGSVNGISGTGRSNSTVTRATNPAGPGSCCSHACANNALGAPPCIAFGFHGPRVSGVGT